VTVLANERRPAPASTDPLKRLVVSASVVLFALSLVLPALGEGELGVRVEPGYMILGTGYFGVLFGQLAWFANPLWVAGLVYLIRRRWKAAAICASLAVVLAAESFLLYSTGFPSDSGATIPVRLLAGFWVWWSSLWVLAAGALVLWRRHRKPDVTEGTFGS
jgi:hypothetical protein